MNKTLYASILLCAFFSINAHGQVITTIAGDGTAGYSGDGFAAASAALHFPQSLALDGEGNLYIGDIGNNRIRMVSNSGIITTYGGNGVPGYSGDGGPASAASLNAACMATDAHGNLYFADPLYNRIRKIGTDGIVSSIAGTGAAAFSGDGGPATAAAFNQPSGITIDASGNIYVSDMGNDRVRKINTSGMVSTVAGGGSSGPGDGGPAVNAQVYVPGNLTIDNSGNLYIISGYNIRKVDASGTITTLSVKPTTLMNQPGAIAVDNSGTVYITELSYNRVYKIDDTGKLINVAGRGPTPYFSGDGGPATAARLATPAGLAIAPSGSIFIADYNNNRIRYVATANASAPATVADISTSIYPNPGSGTFTLTVNTMVEENADVSIVDLTGQKVIEFSMITNKPLTKTITASPGIYFVVTTTRDGRRVDKLIIEH